MIIEQLSSLADDLAALEPWTLTGAEVREVVSAVQKARTSLDATLSRLAGCAADMGLPKDDGATSVTAWLAARTGMTKGEAAKLAGLAKVTTSNTENTRRAWTRGDLSTDQARVIMNAIDTLPEWCGDVERADAETHLISLAGQYGLDDLKRLANRVLEVIDPDGADEHLGDKVRAEEQRAFAATRMSMKRRGDGTTRGVFTIPDADADTLRAAIEGIIAPRRSQFTAERHGFAGADEWNALPREQKMGHAFTELIAHLPKHALPQAGGLAATVAVMIDIDDLRTGQGTATNTSGTTVSATKTQRMACNAHLVALYLDSESRVIDHGMTRRLYDQHQRLILAARDGGCIFPLGSPRTRRIAAGDVIGRRRGAKRTTSSTSPTTAPPTSTTPPCCATSTTSSSTKANGSRRWPPTASPRSSHPHASTPNKNPAATPASPNNNPAPPDRRTRRGASMR